MKRYVILDTELEKNIWRRRRTNVTWIYITIAQIVFHNCSLYSQNKQSTSNCDYRLTNTACCLYCPVSCTMLHFSSAVLTSVRHTSDCAVDFNSNLTASGSAPSLSYAVMLRCASHCVLCMYIYDNMDKLHDIVTPHNPALNRDLCMLHSLAARIISSGSFSNYPSDNKSKVRNLSDAYWLSHKPENVRLFERLWRLCMVIHRDLVFEELPFVLLYFPYRQNEVYNFVLSCTNT